MANFMNPILEIVGRLNSLEAKIGNIESVHLGTRKIELTTKAKVLKMYHNSQMKKLMALNIDLRMFDGMQDDEVVSEEPMQGIPQTQGHVTMRKITVKQQRERYLKAKVDLLRVIKSTEELLAEEGVEITPDVKGN